MIEELKRKMAERNAEISKDGPVVAVHFQQTADVATVAEAASSDVSINITQGDNHEGNMG